jgi:hypothetical protein
MSDRFPGQITIGGPVKKEDLPKLLEKIIYEYGCNEDWEEGNPPENIKDLLNESGYICFGDHDARNGEFSELETFLKEKGIPFNRQSSGCYEYNPEIVYFRKEMKEPIIFITDTDGEELVPLSSVKTIKNFLVKDKKDEAIELLNCLCKDIPSLPKFEIVGE